MLKNNLSIIVFLILFCCIIFAFQANSKPRDNSCLSKSYNLYKKIFMSNDGRIIDYAKKEITTSEGQSYIMLKSLLMEDKETFDLTYNWTKNNLQRKDYLFAWLWGKNPKGEYKILDENSASDADIDIAFSLLLAYEKWKDNNYLNDAKLIINSIWRKEAKRIGNYVVLTPGAEQADEEEKIEINPSYFSPYAFRLFHKYDEIHDWNLLIDSSYYYLNKVCFKAPTGLPPNWFYIEKGQIVLDDSEKSDFSYDAIRVFPRIYLDYKMTKDPRAMLILEKSSIFVSEWQKTETIHTNYKKNGQLRDKNIFIGGIAILLPAIMTYDPKTAKNIYQKIIEPKIEHKNYWSNKKDYYGNNLTWFGLYLYENYLKGCDIKNE